MLSSETMFKDPHRRPTCRISIMEQCGWLSTVGRDTPVCFKGDREVALQENESGYLIPHDQCPIWGNSQ